ncbi:hypothetical protein FQZ97_1046780 [compost metagenome]
MTRASATGSSSTANTASGVAGSRISPRADSALPLPPFGFAGGSEAGMAAAALPAEGGGSSMPSSCITREGVSGSTMSARPSASATALAMQGGVLMLLPSPRPLAPSGVKGLGVSRCRIMGSGTSQVVGTR